MSVYVKEAKGTAQACVIWMHGLGADSNDMVGLSEQLRVDAPIRHVFLDAPFRPVTVNNNMVMRAWYDLRGFNLPENQDREGILESENRVLTVIEDQKAEGFSSEQIFLAGFSQGGAMALFTGLRSKGALGGIIALSSGIPLYKECNISLDAKTPIFFACGIKDPIVLPAWSKKSCEWLQSNNFNHITWCEYPMEHSVCMQEIQDLSQWFNRLLKTPSDQGELYS